MKIIYLLVIPCLFLLGCGSAAESSVDQEVPIATFEGAGDIITEQFFIWGDGSWDFRVSWECTPKYVDAFGLWVHPINTNNPNLAYSPPGESKGTVDVHYAESGISGEAPFVIEIIAPHGCDWVVRVWGAS